MISKQNITKRTQGHTVHHINFTSSSKKQTEFKLEQQSFQQDEQMQKSFIFHQLCSRCLTEEAEFSCESCHNHLFCNECDNKTHLKGKFSIHSRLRIYSKSKPSSLNKQSQLNVKKLTDDTVSAKKITNDQNWDRISEQVSDRFLLLIDLLNQKKNEVLEKIQRRREAQTKKTHSDINPEICQKYYPNSNKFYREGSTKLNTLDSEDLGPIISQNPFDLSLTVFQSIQASMGKLQLKNILPKLNQFSEKRNMKRSLDFIPQIATAFSPLAKKNGNTKSNLSQGSFETGQVESSFKQALQLRKKISEQKEKIAFLKSQSVKLLPHTGIKKYPKKEKTLVSSGFF